MDRADRLEDAGARSGENGLCDELVAADVDDAAACARAVAGRTDIAAVLTFRELSVAPVAAIAQCLGLRGNDPAVIDRVRNKDLCRAWLREHGFPQPSTRPCTSADEAAQFMRESGDGPWIVKPCDGLASLGVSLVRDGSELAAAISRLDRGERFLIETFVSGDEISAEGVMLEGRPEVIALTRKTLDRGVGFIAARQRQPAGLADDVAAAASAEVARAVESIGITHGHFHVELWLTRDGIVLGEMHARSGGDYIVTLVEETHPGLSMFGALIDDLMARPAAALPSASRAAGVTFLPFPSGTITSIDGWDAIRAHERVVACHLQVKVGQTVAETVGSFDRPAVIVVSAATLDEVETVTDELAAGLVVTAS
jgi:biotin carboxylase